MAVIEAELKIQYKYMIVVDEMQKLRDELDKRGIEWRDISDFWGLKMYNALKDENGNMPKMSSLDDDFWKHEWIVRTHFEYKGLYVSCINGFGTYGGYDLIRSVAGEHRNRGLIEMLVSGVSDPIGFLTCKDVCKKHQL